MWFTAAPMAILAGLIQPWAQIELRLWPLKLVDPKAFSMEVAEILAERAVLYCTASKTKSQLFEELAARAAELTGQPAAAILESVQNREELGSTGLGNGIAIPHGKIAGLKAVTALFARLEQPIEFDAVDDQPVDIVVMLLAPAGAGAGADHLKALSRFARMLRTEHIVNDVRAMTDPAKIYALLTAPTATHYAA